MFADTMSRSYWNLCIWLFFFSVVPKLLFVGMKVPDILKNNKTSLKP